MAGPNAKSQHVILTLPAEYAAGQQQSGSRCGVFRRRSRVCASVSPWITTLSCIMVALGLAVWYLYTKKALVYTQSVAAQLFADQRIYMVDQLSSIVGWTTLIGVIVVSCMLGLTMFVSLLRTYQLSARLPSTSCGAPGKLSYGTYATLTAMLNMGWWLITVAVALTIAASLCWLMLAFATSSAVTMGVRYSPDAAMTNAAYYATARDAVDGLNTYASKVQRAVPADVASLPEVDAMNKHIRSFVAASKEVPVTVCPTSCLNIGSLYDTLRLPTSCVCSDANMLDVADQAASTWKTLVHVLAALALMGLGCLWLLMNLSAEFAHARRDARELPGRSPTALTQESIAAIQATPFSATSSKKGRTSPTKATRDQDIARFVALAGTEEFTGIDALPEAVLEPAPALEQQQRTYSTNNAYAVHGDNSSAHAAAAGSMLADAPVVAQSPKRRAASPTRNTEGEASPSNSRGATLNSTAQRYAAYRLRAAQAAAAKATTGSSGGGDGRKQWIR